MTRNIGFVILMIALGLLTLVMLSEHRQQMPLVQAGYPQGDAHLLVSPCPIEPRNFPQWRERKA